MQYIKFFNQLTIKNVPEVGGKNASLGEMYRKLAKKGIVVPNGFATTADAYNNFLDYAGIRNGIKDALKGLDTHNVTDLAKRGAKVRKLIIDSPFSKDFENSIKEAVGIGEIGLDYKEDIKKSVSVDLQKSVLRRLLAIAKRDQKPVIIHSRYAWQDTFDLVKESGVEKAVFHWYSGTSSVRRKIIEGNYFLSANPAAEYSREHREAIKDASLDRLLLETDSPVRDWEPADVLKSLNAVAELKNLSQEEIAQITTDNAIKFFDLPLKL